MARLRRTSRLRRALFRATLILALPATGHAQSPPATAETPPAEPPTEAGASVESNESLRPEASQSGSEQIDPPATDPQTVDPDALLQSLSESGELGDGGLPPSVDGQAGDGDTSQPAADSLRVQGNLRLRAGFQRSSDRSIFPGPDTGDGLRAATYNANAVLRIDRAGFGALFDVQHEHQAQSGEGRDRVNQLFLSANLGRSFKLRVGKQRVLWGRGFSYIPTDFINPPLDPSGLDLAKVGVEAISADYVGKRFAVSALVRAEEGDDPDTIGVKFASSAIAGVDLDLVYFHAPSIGNAYGGSFAVDAMQVLSPKLSGLVFYGGFAMHHRSRYPQPLRVFADFAGDGNAFEALLPGALGTRGDYASYLLGLSYEANDRLSMYAEYYRIGDAYGRRDHREMLDALSGDDPLRRQLATRWLPSLAFGRSQRDYVSVSGGLSSLTDGANRFGDNLSLELAALFAPGDRSALFSTALRSGYFDSAEIVWRNLFPTGGRGSEFGSAPFRWYTELSINVFF